MLPCCYNCVFGKKAACRPHRTPLDHSEAVFFFFSSTLIRAKGVFSDPDTHSSKMSWWNIARGLIAALRDDSNLSHRFHECSDFSFTEG